MKKRGCFIAVGVCFFFLFCFGIFIYFVASLLGKGEGFSLKDAAIAVVEVEGTILDGKDTLETLKKISKDEDIKAVVLRVDSPGGAIGPSQEIYEALRKLAKKKKLVVSQGSVAASGGYYISLAGEKIYALPGTVTGSIGVLMDYINVEELLQFAKVKAEILKAGARKDIGSSLRAMTDEERKFLLDLLAHMHAQFKKAVQEARHLTDQEINELADGRVFSGEQAKAAKLVDEIGTLDDAIEAAAKLAGIEGEPEVSYPGRKRKNFLNLLLEEDAESAIKRIFYSMQQVQFMYLMKGIQI